jgi:hypothetical protein
MARKGGAPDNLKPFKKGLDERRNLKGAPPRIELKEALIKVLMETNGGITAYDAVLKALRNKAIKGDVRAIELIFDRVAGKVSQNISIEKEQVTAIEFRVKK